MHDWWQENPMAQGRLAARLCRSPLADFPFGLGPTAHVFPVPIFKVLVVEAKVLKNQLQSVQSTIKTLDQGRTGFELNRPGRPPGNKVGLESRTSDNGLPTLSLISNRINARIATATTMHVLYNIML
jgi:hypothetical protein